MIGEEDVEHVAVVVWPLAGGIGPWSEARAGRAVSMGGWVAKTAFDLCQRRSASETNPRHAHQVIPERRANGRTSETKQSGASYKSDVV
jgi:hypothetical protein